MRGIKGRRVKGKWNTRKMDRGSLKDEEKGRKYRGNVKERERKRDF